MWAVMYLNSSDGGHGMGEPPGWARPKNLKFGSAVEFLWV